MRTRSAGTLSSTATEFEFDLRLGRVLRATDRGEISLSDAETESEPAQDSKNTESTESISGRIPDLRKPCDARQVCRIPGLDFDEKKD